MDAMTRCGAIPPHLLEHLAQSSNEHRARRAQATLQADQRHRTARIDIPVPTQPDDEDEAEAGEQPQAGNPNRTIHDAAHSEHLPGKEVRTEGAPETDDPAVTRAYDHLGATYRLFSEVYGRDSLDGKGLPLIASVHYGTDYANAFWDGRQMAFGDGDGDLFVCFTSALDVIAHELTHGVVERTARLAYFDQAGALNEHLADVFGALAEQYAAGHTADKATWLIGDGLFTDAVEGAALRSMKAPGTAYDDDVLGKDPQPAHMDDYVETFMDNGGVHINSGIPNRAFYLAATEIGGNAWETAGKVWYEALTSGEVKRDATFEQFAAATSGAAVRLFGDGSAQVKAVNAAWEGVGVPTP
ncbi:M4 family metallopeptidase [Streptomyces cellulosae]|uniref:Neutral metalloproteinase n=1 Tax=Streptomyces cellulosae TaxID=1968 RepID=A0ABW6JEM9_STRCE